MYAGMPWLYVTHLLGSPCYDGSYDYLCLHPRCTHIGSKIDSNHRHASASNHLAQIETRLREALQYISANRLLIAPDCGLGFLPPPILESKLASLPAAVLALRRGLFSAEAKVLEDSDSAAAADV